MNRPLRGAGKWVSSWLLLLFLGVMGPLRAEMWDWSYAYLDVPHSPGDSLLTTATIALKLQDDISLRYLKSGPDSTYQVIDTSPDPTHHSWERHALPQLADGTRLWGHFGTDGDEITCDLVSLQDSTLTFRHYHLNPDDQAPTWSINTTHITTGLVQSFIDENLTAQTADLNGDGLRDWILVNADGYSPSLIVFIATPDSESPWNLVQTPLLPYSGDPINWIFSFTLAHSNDPAHPFYLLIPYAIEDWGSMNHDLGPTQLLSVHHLDSATPSLSNASLLEGYSRPLSAVSMDDSGNDAILANRDGTWEVYATVNGINFSLTGTTSAPDDIVGMETLPEDPTHPLYYVRTLSFLGDDFEGWWATTIHRYSFDPATSTWSAVDRILHLEWMQHFRRFSHTSGNNTHQALFISGMVHDPPEPFPFTQVNQQDAQGENWQTLPYTYFYNVFWESYNPNFTNLDDDSELEGLTLTLQGLLELDYVNNDWQVGRTWELPDGDIHGFTLIDLDNDGLDDVYTGGEIAFLQCRDGDTISWQRVRPFGSLVAPPGIPYGILDFDGDGSNDFLFYDGTVLLNHSSTAVREKPGAAVPGGFRIVSTYPNPFNPTTSISLAMPHTGHVVVSVYDLLGRRVAVLADGAMQPGTTRVPFDGSALASGVYFVRAAFEGCAVQSRKIVSMK